MSVNEALVHVPDSQLAPMSFDQMNQMAGAIASSKLFGMQTTEQAFVLMALCAAEGKNPIQAVRQYHIINGRPAMRADAMLAEFQNRGGTVQWLERSNTAVSGQFTHYAGGEVTITWTLEDAKRAGLLNNPTWTKFPRQMLTARVISEAIRTILPGVVAGIYTPEEVADFEPTPAPRHAPSPQGPRSIPAQEPKALSAPVESIPASDDRERMAAAKETFSQIAGGMGLSFQSPKERGEWANSCLGRAVDSRAPITVEDWKSAALALPAEVRKSAGVPEPDERFGSFDDERAEELVANVPDAAAGSVAATEEDLTDPFADDVIPEAKPSLPRKGRTIPANTIPGTENTETRGTVTGAGLL